MHYRSFCDPSKVFEYFERRDEFINSVDTQEFRNAVEQLEQYVKNPDVSFTFQFLLFKFDCRRINIYLFIGQHIRKYGRK